jgi:predicted CXXCH cytochrome family protein
MELGCFIVLVGFVVGILLQGRDRRAVTLAGVLFASGVAGGVLAWRAGTTRSEVRPADAPREGRPGGYVSSIRCGACHPAEYASWHRTFHRTMTQYATLGVIRAPWKGVLVDEGGAEYRLEQRGDQLSVDLIKGDWPDAPAADEPSPQARRPSRRVDLVTGSHHMQVYWVRGDHGNAQLPLPFTYLIDETRWVPRKASFLAPPDAPFASFARESWNINCIQCHATAGQPERGSDGFATRVAEMGIACEACHGPAEEHVAANANPLRRYWLHLGGGPDPTIVNPRRLPAVRSSQVCGQCHGIRWIMDERGYLSDGLTYRPGDDLDASTPLIRAALADRHIWIRKVLAANPGYRERRFWSDGMARVSGREWSGLAESPCMKGGQISCLSCHSMHASEPNRQLSTGKSVNQACTGCHVKFDAGELTQHTHHRPESPGSECMNCHMPYTVYGLLRAMRSHQIDSPSVAKTLATGRPDACNLCHLDKTLDWAAGLLSRWYRQPTVDVPPAQRRTSAALGWLLSGDAGQRALIGWSMGWPPARAASGDDWIAPFLAVLLEDPYAAVRYLAGRSLAAGRGSTAVGYDYVGDPTGWARARAEVRDRWKGSQRKGEAELLLTEDGQVREEAVQALLRRRDDRPMLLDE